MSFESAQIMCTHLIECWQWAWPCGRQTQTASASRDWHPLRHCWELCAERLITPSQQQISKQWEHLNRQLALGGIIYGCVQVQPWDLVEPLLPQGLSVMSARASLVTPVTISLQWWIKTLQHSNQLLSSKDMFLQCFPLLILILCYNNTTQHIQHSTFNQSEAWDNLERKLNITFYFRAKEIRKVTCPWWTTDIWNPHRSSSFSTVLFIGSSRCWRDFWRSTTTI